MAQNDKNKLNKKSKKNKNFWIFLLFIIAILLILIFGFHFWQKKIMNTLIANNYKIQKELKNKLETQNNNFTTKNNKEHYNSNISPQKAKNIIADKSKKIILALKNKNMETLAQYVHPKKDLKFSPYAFIKDSHKKFTAEEIKTIATDPKIYNWGVYDGTGKPINKKFLEYYDEFIYDHDFANAEKTVYNTIIIHGNTINNISQYYDNPLVTEYYFSGFNPEYAGMDWASLRLVFQKYNNKWYLVNIVHDQWTI
jgi:uncharacterized protein YneF (UPF0154 family)